MAVEHQLCHFIEKVLIDGHNLYLDFSKERNLYSTSTDFLTVQLFREEKKKKKTHERLSNSRSQRWANKSE